MMDFENKVNSAEVIDENGNMKSGKEMQQTKKCGLCEKEIEIAKFRIHDAMCSRINYKCLKCGFIVQKADRERHDLELCGREQTNDSFVIGNSFEKSRDASRAAILNVKTEEEKEEQSHDYDEGKVRTKLN